MAIRLKQFDGDIAAKGGRLAHSDWKLKSIHLRKWR
jgi:hypothetical protein